VRLDVVGAENVPQQPPYILVANHLAIWDAPVLLLVMPHVVTPFAAAKHRSNPIFAPILEAAGVIWVKRGEADVGALREALSLLDAGGVLGVAPEGTRSRQARALLEGKPGTAYLALRAQVPILPVALTGTEKIRLNIPRLRRTNVRVVVGEPFRLPHVTRPRREDLQSCTSLIMHRIAELLPPKYRGAYGSTVCSMAPNLERGCRLT
jgi:1-acyl-sn-glycerol-3-phosphate acyltransferase